MKQVKVSSQRNQNHSAQNATNRKNQFSAKLVHHVASDQPHEKTEHVVVNDNFMGLQNVGFPSVEDDFGVTSQNAGVREPGTVDLSSTIPWKIRGG